MSCKPSPSNSLHEDSRLLRETEHDQGSGDMLEVFVIVLKVFDRCEPRETCISAIISGDFVSWIGRTYAFLP